MSCCLPAGRYQPAGLISISNSVVPRQWRIPYINISTSNFQEGFPDTSWYTALKYRAVLERTEDAPTRAAVLSSTGLTEHMHGHMRTHCCPADRPQPIAWLAYYMWWNWVCFSVMKEGGGWGWVCAGEWIAKVANMEGEGGGGARLKRGRWKVKRTDRGWIM